MQKKENALQLLHENVKSESLRRHCLAVATAMEFYARKFLEDGKIVNENKFNEGKINDKLIDDKLNYDGLESDFDNFALKEKIKSEDYLLRHDKQEILDKWWACGLLHDFDWEIHPTMEQHPVEGVKILRSLGYDEEICEAILGHGNHTGVPRRSLMAKTLFAVDELCGLIIALARVRPGGFEGMNSDSVKKAMKKKDFAAAINRDDIRQGINELSVDENGHFELVIGALKGIKGELGF